MKKIFLLPIVIFLLISSVGKTQVLNVPQTIQENNQWCWAGCSKCILDYYGVVLNQCDIAEYARTQVQWTSYGTTNCCVDPNQGCNYWNYNFGFNGSIQDILIHFGGIQNSGVYSDLTLAQINTECAGGRPFVVRWGWAAGGGHFVVGHGVNGNNVNYMNPWPGEGLHVATYSWLQTDGNHTWTHTNLLTTSPNGIDPVAPTNDDASVFPNPASEEFTVSIGEQTNLENSEFVLTDVAGREVMKSAIENHETKIATENLTSGIYFYQLINAGEILKNGKLIIQ